MAYLLDNIRKAGDKSWTAYAWILERCYPDEFGLKTKQDMTFKGEIGINTMTQDQREKEIERLNKLRGEDKEKENGKG